MRSGLCRRCDPRLDVRIVSRAREAASHSLLNDRDLIHAVGLAQMLQSSTDYACITLNGHEQQVWIVEASLFTEQAADLCRAYAPAHG